MTFGRHAIRGLETGIGGEVDYRLTRRMLISEYKKGRLAQHEVCDAHPELIRAAQHCSETTTQECPICEEVNLVLVTYVFGPKLPAFGRCITTKSELQEFLHKKGPYHAYIIEVCAQCHWNHLARALVLQPG